MNINMFCPTSPNIDLVFFTVHLSSSIINIPGESTLRRDFLRLQLANKERSEAQRRQQLEQQQNEEHKRLLLAERQKRIEEQKEQRRRLEEVRENEVKAKLWKYTVAFQTTKATKIHMHKNFKLQNIVGHKPTKKEGEEEKKRSKIHWKI